MPDQGEVFLAGEPLKHWSRVEMAMRRAVMLQQATISFPRAVRESLTTADAEQFKDPDFSSLSGPHPDTTAPVILPARR